MNVYIHGLPNDVLHMGPAMGKQTGICQGEPGDGRYTDAEWGIKDGRRRGD